jgi:hypothetical protein
MTDHPRFIYDLNHITPVDSFDSYGDFEAKYADVVGAIDRLHLLEGFSGDIESIRVLPYPAYFPVIVHEHLNNEHEGVQMQTGLVNLHQSFDVVIEGIGITSLAHHINPLREGYIIYVITDELMAGDLSEATYMIVLEVPAIQTQIPDNEPIPENG